MKNRDDLIAWAWSELDRVTTQASRIDDTSSEPVSYTHLRAHET